MGKEAPFVVELTQAQRRLHIAQTHLGKTQELFKSGDVARAYTAAFAYAAEVEWLLLHARTLPAYTGCGRYLSDLTTHLNSYMPIEIGVTQEGWLRLRIPALLPKKEKGSPDYIRESLYMALRTYFNHHPRYQLQEATLVFCHQYRPDRPERQLRDHDNIEVNAVVDALAMYVLVDDAPLRCNHFYCSIRSPTDGTEVLVLPQEAFPKWLETHLKTDVNWGVKP